MEEISNRINTALQFLEDGQSYSIGELRIGIESANSLYVTGWTKYIILENLTKTEALLELNEIKEMFTEMAEISPALKKFIQGKNIEFNLAFNYGMGSIGICSEQNGLVHWMEEIRD